MTCTTRRNTEQEYAPGDLPIFHFSLHMESPPTVASSGQSKGVAAAKSSSLSRSSGGVRTLGT